jgi:hypothetical protein
MIAVLAIPTSCLVSSARIVAELDYRWKTTAAAISSAKKIGINTGGTSHSRTSNLLVSDI